MKNKEGSEEACITSVGVSIAAVGERVSWVVCPAFILSTESSLRSESQDTSSNGNAEVDAAHDAEAESADLFASGHHDTATNTAEGGHGDQKNDAVGEEDSRPLSAFSPAAPVVLALVDDVSEKFKGQIQVIVSLLTIEDLDRVELVVLDGISQVLAQISNILHFLDSSISDSESKV